MSQEQTQGSVIKIQNKIANFLETNTEFSDKRTQFIQLNKQYRGLSKQEKPQDVQQQVEKVMMDANGVEVRVTQLVKKRTFPTQEVQTLYTDLKKKRKEILRFNKPATLYLNMLCEKIIEDFISSCEPISKNKKTQEKTFGWKQFNKQRFSQSFTYSLVQSSKYFNDFLTVKYLINQFRYDKEILRISHNMTKAESTTVYQDLQRFKFLKTKQQPVSEQELQKQIEEEFNPVWGKHLQNMYEMLEHLQSDDDNSKFLFNNVKNVTRMYQEQQKQRIDVVEDEETKEKPEDQQTTGEEDQKKVKISNGFKNMIAKIIKEMLVSMSHKIQLYLEGQPNHQIKLADIKKIIKISSSLDSVDELRKQYEEFDRNVDERIKEIEQLKVLQKEKSQSQKKQVTESEQVKAQ